MKRLALAASIALAVSTIGVGPAVANSPDTSPELTTQGNAQPTSDAAENAGEAADPGENDTADDPGTPDPGTADPGTDDAQVDGGQGQEGDHDGAETSDPDAPTSPGEEAPDLDGNEDGAAEDAAEDANDDAADGAEESEPIEADFALEKTTMTAEEIGDPEKGISYTIDSLKAGDIVTAEPGEDASTTLEEDGAFTGEIVGNTELKPGDTLDVTVTVEREGQETKTFSGSIEVVAADDEDAPDAELTVSPQKLGLHRFLNEGVGITLVNCVVDEEVTFRISTKSDLDTTVWEDTQMAGEDAAGFSTFIPDGDGGANWVGDYLVMASCGDQSEETTFTVTADDSVVDPQKISDADFIDRDKGVTITVTECNPGSDVQFEVWGLEPSGKLYEQTVEANKNGAASVQIYGLENNPDAYAGTYKVIANCMDRELIDDFVVTGSGGGAGGSESGSDNGSDDSGNAGSMPRTGAELTGLGAGAALILGGAATIIFARRRSQTGQ